MNDVEVWERRYSTLDNLGVWPHHIHALNHIQKATHDIYSRLLAVQLVSAGKLVVSLSSVSLLSLYADSCFHRLSALPRMTEKFFQLLIFRISVKCYSILNSAYSLNTSSCTRTSLWRCRTLRTISVRSKINGRIVSASILSCIAIL